MKNYVILLAGGVGKRMGTDIPKQFLEVDGKPIIVYSIENFQKNPQIEKIVVGSYGSSYEQGDYPIDTAITVYIVNQQLN